MLPKTVGLSREQKTAYQKEMNRATARILSHHFLGSGCRGRWMTAVKRFFFFSVSASVLLMAFECMALVIFVLGYDHGKAVQALRQLALHYSSAKIDKSGIVLLHFMAKNDLILAFPVGLLGALLKIDRSPLCTIQAHWENVSREQRARRKWRGKLDRITRKFTRKHPI